MARYAHIFVFGEFIWKSRTFTLSLNTQLKCLPIIITVYLSESDICLYNQFLFMVINMKCILFWYIVELIITVLHLKLKTWRFFGIYSFWNMFQFIDTYGCSDPPAVSYTRAYNCDLALPAHNSLWGSVSLCVLVSLLSLSGNHRSLCMSCLNYWVSECCACLCLCRHVCLLFVN